MDKVEKDKIFLLRVIFLMVIVVSGFVGFKKRVNLFIIL